MKNEYGSYGEDTKKIKTSKAASLEVAFPSWSQVRRSCPRQGKAAGQQRHLPERRGFGEGISHGRTRRAPGGTGVASRRPKAAGGAGAKERQS